MGKLFLWNADRIKQDADHRLVTDSEKTTWNSKMENWVDITTDLEITNLTTPGKYRFIQQYASTGCLNNITFKGNNLQYNGTCWYIIVEKTNMYTSPILLDGTEDTTYPIHEGIIILAYISIKEKWYCMQWHCESESNDGESTASLEDDDNKPVVKSNSNVIAPFDTSKYKYVWHVDSECENKPIPLLVDTSNYITNNGTSSLSGDIVPGRYSSPNLGSYGRRFGDIYTTIMRSNDGYFGGDTGDYNGIVICETPNPNPIYNNALGIKYAILSYKGSPSSLPNYGYLTLRRNDFYSVTITPDLDNGTSNGVNVELPWQSGKLVNNMIVTDWNEAVYTGFYRSEANAKNMPSGETNAAAGYVFALNNLIVQHIYIDDSLNGDSKIQMWVRRKGNNTWGDWHITSFYDPK